MNLENRISAFSALGIFLKNLDQNEKEEWQFRAQNHNSWFTAQNVALAFEGLQNYLNENNLRQWLANYDLTATKSKTVGVVMAGNIPMVGVHDWLSVLLAGHHLLVKLSSTDPFLIKKLSQILIEIEPKFANFITFTENQLANFDAIIATGSDNTARYFDYYFAKYPNIIRKNRTSVAVLNGTETPLQIQKLGHDIFDYFGLGCRNVSKIYVPKGYDFVHLLDNLESFNFVTNHHKYRNNYDYNKSIYLVNRELHLDNGFLLLNENSQLLSPISVLYYEYYDFAQDWKDKIFAQKDKLQCVISADSVFENSLDFGQAQQPNLWDYADGVDTMAFLRNL
ncbi:MAG: acyl-CoA reductase [Bacteroidetes bacterium]|nr:MAG: acyl-CoA reductase [Bacteroidota bacterium]